MDKPKVSAKAVAADIRSDMSTAELMEKYGLSATGLARLFQKLVEKNVFTSVELSDRLRELRESVRSETRETTSDPSENRPEQLAKPQLAEKVLAEVKRGTLDYDIMIRLGLGRDDLRALLDDLIRQGHLSAEEIEAREPRGVMDEGSTSAEASPDQTCAWEDYWNNRSSRGLFRAYFRTVAQCLTSPKRFFSALPLDSGYWAPTLFGASAAAVPIAFHLISYEIRNRVLGILDVGQLIFFAVLAFLFAVVLSSLILLIWSLLINATLMVLRGDRREFQATYRVVSYAFIMALFTLIPAIGSFVAFGVGLYLVGIGLRETHKISIGKASVAWLAPWIFVLAYVVMQGTIPDHGTKEKSSWFVKSLKISGTPAKQQQDSATDDSISQLTVYRTDTGGFSVIAPSRLREKRMTAETVLGKFTAPMFQTKQGNVEFSIVCPARLPWYVRYLLNLPLPAVSRAQEAEKRLDDFRNLFVKKLKGKIVSESKLALENLPGRQIVISGMEGSKPDAVLEIHLYLAGEQFYQVMVVAPDGELDTPEINDFFASFKIIE